MTDKRKVVISPGFGAGFATWHRCDEAMYRIAELPELVAYVESGGHDEDELRAILERAEIIGPDDHFYMGGASDLVVQEVTVPYCIIEYDGSEYVVDATELRY